MMSHIVQVSAAVAVSSKKILWYRIVEVIKGCINFLLARCVFDKWNNKLTFTCCVFCDIFSSNNDNRLPVTM